MAQNLEDKTRSDEIWRLREEGQTYKEIARRFGVTPERVRQIYYREKDRRENAR